MKVEIKFWTSYVILIHVSIYTIKLLLLEQKH